MGLNWKKNHSNASYHQTLVTTQESTLQRMCALVYDRRDKISVMGMCSLAVQRICYNCVFSGLFYHLYPPVKCTMVQIHSPDNQLNVIQREEFRYINRPCCVSIDMYISDYYLPTFVFWQVCWFDGLYMCDCMCVCVRVSVCLDGRLRIVHERFDISSPNFSHKCILA